MTDTATRLATRLVDGRDRTVQFFSKLSPEQRSVQVYIEGNCWTVGDILAHMLATEISIYRLLVHILNGGPGAPEDFDINAYNERKVWELREIDPPELLQRFKDERETTIQLVLGLSMDDLAKQGRHPFLGPASLSEIIKLMCMHNQIHIRDIRRMLPTSEGKFAEG
ncbi:MAG: DinB family protein [Chloroflexi bacterium]|nr:MAG: DinB family protein [Chloroflexota bacterium]